MAPPKVAYSLWVGWVSTLIVCAYYHPPKWVYPTMTGVFLLLIAGYLAWDEISVLRAENRED